MEGVNVSEVNVSLPDIPDRITTENITKEQIEQLEYSIYRLMWMVKSYEKNRTNKMIQWLINDCTDESVKQLLIEQSKVSDMNV